MNELPSVFVSDRVRAAREHVCCECHGKIAKGEFYNNDRGCWEGSWATFKVCLDCDALRKEVDIDEHDPAFWTPYGSLYESVFESRDVNLIERFLETKRKRGATIPDWMTERLSVIKAPVVVSPVDYQI